MNKPNFKDFKLKSIKLLKNGGAEVVWSYPYSAGPETHTDTHSVKRSIDVHKDLFDLLNKNKGNILMVEEIDYRLMAKTLERMPGSNSAKEVAQIAEGMTADALSKLQVTGISLSGKGDKKNAIITYKKITGDKKIIGRPTSLIQLSSNVYGFEQELESDIEDICKEVYAYIYDDKHSDSDQLDLGLFSENQDKIKEAINKDGGEGEEKTNKKAKKSK